LFAPKFHGAMKYAAGPRKEIGIRTIFNVLGPLTNPAGAEIQLLGVYDADLARKLAHALHRLGGKAAYVVYGAGGLDELTLAGHNLIMRISEQGVEGFSLCAADVGLAEAPVEALLGGSPAKNATIILQVLEGVLGPQRDVVLLNAGATAAAAGRVATIREGIELAVETIDSGAALSKLKNLIQYSQALVRSIEQKAVLAGK